MFATAHPQGLPRFGAAGVNCQPGEEIDKGRFEQARMDAGRLPEPKVQRVDLPRRTLTDEAELADWLDEPEARIGDWERVPASPARCCWKSS